MPRIAEWSLARPKGWRLSPRSAWTLRSLGALLALVGLLLYLRGFYRQELYHFTENAEWIWCTSNVHNLRPTACVLYRDLRLHERPLEAVAKICGDRSYVLWINGQLAMAGYNRPRYHLDVVPVTDLLNPGPNLFAIEVRSPTSVGALLFSLDLTPSAEGLQEGDPRGRGVLVSDRRWRVAERWWPGFPGLVPAEDRTPWVWGRPPDHPWGYPAPIRYPVPLAQAISGPGILVSPDLFRRGKDGVWRYELDGPFSGILWLQGALPPPGTVEIRLTSGGTARSRMAFRPVVTLPGQRRWLLAGIVRGSVIEIKTKERPPAVFLTRILHEGSSRAARDANQARISVRRE